MDANDVMNFWAGIGKKGWWRSNAAIDAEIHAKFGKIHQAACEGRLDYWAEDANGALALIIVLDQFSRNMFRGDAKSFSQDEKALQISCMSVDKGYDKACRQDLRIFFYLPFEHSESIVDQERSVLLQYHLNEADAMGAALEHRDIIRRFGRFPHRNKVLGRHTTPAEQAYLDEGGFKG